MSKKVFMDAFYNQFADFVSQLQKVFPEDTDFPTYATGLRLMRMTNPLYIVKQFQASVLPFEESIRAKKEDFFLTYDFSQLGAEGWLMEVIAKLKGMWSTLSENNKKCIWDYINLLLDIAKRCAD